MRKLLFFALLYFTLSASAQHEVKIWDRYDVGWWTTTRNKALTVKERGVRDGIVDIEFKADASPHCLTWPVFITNYSSKTITVKWMKSQIKGSRIVTGETPMIAISTATPDDIIYPGSILYKKITSVAMAENEYSRLFRLDYAKKAYKKEKKPQTGDARIVLCLEIDGEEKIYEFTLHGVYNGKRK